MLSTGAGSGRRPPGSLPAAAEPRRRRCAAPPDDADAVLVGRPGPRDPHRAAAAGRPWPLQPVRHNGPERDATTTLLNRLEGDTASVLWMWSRTSFRHLVPWVHTGSMRPYDRSMRRFGARDPTWHGSHSRLKPNAGNAGQPALLVRHSFGHVYQYDFWHTSQHG